MSIPPIIEPEHRPAKRNAVSFLRGAAVGLFLLTFVFAPWTTRIGLQTVGEISPIWNQPNDSTLNVVVLAVEWVGIVGLYLGLKRIFR